MQSGDIGVSVRKTGLRRARIVAANRRVIEVLGRNNYGERIGIVLGRERNRPVMD